MPGSQLFVLQFQINMYFLDLHIKNLMSTYQTQQNLCVQFALSFLPKITQRITRKIEGNVVTIEREGPVSHFRLLTDAQVFPFHQ